MSRPGDDGPADARAGPWLSLVFRADQPLSPSSRLELRGSDEVCFGRRGAFRIERTRENGARMLVISLQDSVVSRRHARLQKVLGEWLLDDLNSRNGTWVNGARIQRRRIEDGDVVEIGRSFFLFRAAAIASTSAGDLELDAHARRGARTLHPAWEEALSRLQRVAASELPVVLVGETGTGKELLACNLHVDSGRAGSFVAINCGALPEELVESELFGHRRGAFSGAVRDTPGLLRAADGGTLLLDEVADLPLGSQPTLLRTLQERAVTPVGGTRPLPVDLRVVSAAHQDLTQLVHEGKFRPDLLARLSGMTVALPPLRDRREDLGMLIGQLLPAEYGPLIAGFTVEAARALMLHPWPQNVRQLERCLESAAVLAAPGPICLHHLPPELRGGQAPAPAAPQAPGDEATRQHRELLLRLLSEEQGNIAEVARRLQKGRTQVQRWIQRYDIDVAPLRH